MPGTLWLVGTPIGNLGDISSRALERLAAADVIACEDTRRTRALLSHFKIRATRLLSIHEGNERRRVSEILGHLRDGWDVAVVTDAGMPGLSDPGYALVAACAAEGLPVDAVPGPSAAIDALVLSGLPTDRFAFEGFLPRKTAARRARLQELATDPRTLIFYESPRRIASFLRDAHDVLGDRLACVARELTKLHQQVIRRRLSELADDMVEVRGEIVVVVGGAPPDDAASLEGPVARVRELTAHGMSHRDAAALVADDEGVSRRALYEATLEPDPDGGRR